MTRHASALAALGLVMTLATAPPVRADVREDVFAVTAAFDASFFGRLSLPGDARPKIGATVGGALRLEGLFATHFALGVEGVASWTTYVGSEPLPEGAFAIVDSNGFARVRIPLDDGTAEYYLIAGAGASWLPYGDSDPNALSQGVGVGAAVGWNVFARVGVRAELADGVGVLIEAGYRRRQIDGALVASAVDGAAHDYVADQLSLALGWFGAL